VVAPGTPLHRHRIVLRLIRTGGRPAIPTAAVPAAVGGWRLPWGHDESDRDRPPDHGWGALCARHPRPGRDRPRPARRGARTLAPSQVSTHYPQLAVDDVLACLRYAARVLDERDPPPAAARV